MLCWDEIKEVEGTIIVYEAGFLDVWTGNSPHPGRYTNVQYRFPDKLEKMTLDHDGYMKIEEDKQYFFMGYAKPMLGDEKPTHIMVVPKGPIVKKH